MFTIVCTTCSSCFVKIPLRPWNRLNRKADHFLFTWVKIVDDFVRKVQLQLLALEVTEAGLSSKGTGVWHCSFKQLCVHSVINSQWGPSALLFNMKPPEGKTTSGTVFQTLSFTIHEVPLVTNSGIIVFPSGNMDTQCPILDQLINSHINTYW